jgi:transposase InsO family protein
LALEVAGNARQDKRRRPYTPRTNGKAERFIQTSLREWAYARAFETSHQRAQALKPFLVDYNTVRTHSGIRHETPMLRLNNLLGNNSKL